MPVYNYNNQSSGWFCKIRVIDRKELKIVDGLQLQTEIDDTVQTSKVWTQAASVHSTVEKKIE